MSNLPVKFDQRSALARAADLVSKGVPQNEALEQVGLNPKGAEIRAAIARALERLVEDSVAADIVKAELLGLIMDEDKNIKLQAIREAPRIFAGMAQATPLDLHVTAEQVARVEKAVEEK